MHRRYAVGLCAGGHLIQPVKKQQNPVLFEPELGKPSWAEILRVKFFHYPRKHWGPFEAPTREVEDHRHRLCRVQLGVINEVATQREQRERFPRTWFAENEQSTATFFEDFRGALCPRQEIRLLARQLNRACPRVGRNSRYRGDNPELSEARGKE